MPSRIHLWVDMAYSYESYTGNGSNVQFNVPFPYIAQAHVHVYVQGVEDTAFTWINASLIKTSITPPNGVKVIVKRLTPRDALVDFVDGTTLGEDQLDLLLTQALYLSQEALDAAAFTVDPQRSVGRAEQAHHQRRRSGQRPGRGEQALGAVAPDERSRWRRGCA